MNIVHRKTKKIERERERERKERVPNQFSSEYNPANLLS
jgi:hypothetical protein